MIEFRIKDIANLINAEVKGDPNLSVNKLGEIQNAETGDLSFISNPKYYKYAHETKASALIVNKDFEDFSKNKTYLICSNPYEALMKIAHFLDDFKTNIKREIHTSAVIDPSSDIGENVSIGANCVIEENTVIGNNTIIRPGTVVGRDSKIGSDCILHPNVTIYRKTIIGDRAAIHSSTVIGSDGYGYVTLKDGSHKKIPQLGIVVIEDDVEIGSNVSIDRAAIGKTIIGKGTKIDNLVQIAHGVKTGKDNLIVAQVGISGSTVIGSNVTIAGQVGIVGHIEIGDKVIIGAKSGIHKSLPDNSVVSGNPAVPHKDYLRISGAVKKLPDLLKDFKKLIRDLKKKNIISE